MTGASLLENSTCVRDREHRAHRPQGEVSDHGCPPHRPLWWCGVGGRPGLFLHSHLESGGWDRGLGRLHDVKEADSSGPGDISWLEGARLRRVLCDLDLCAGISGDVLVRFKHRSDTWSFWWFMVLALAVGMGRGED